MKIYISIDAVSDVSNIKSEISIKIILGKNNELE